jgi:xanthine dehydrogenase molybdopterin-binding subunit B
MLRAVLSVDNSYFCPNMRVVGRVCKTNTPSNTAFRAFGMPQAQMFFENALDHAARVMGVSSDELRKVQFWVGFDDVMA